MAVTYTYDDTAIREDLLDVITNLDYNETQLGSGLAKGTADAVIHQWMKDTLKTPAANAKIEGADASYSTRTNPERLTNYSQIIGIDYQVSESDRAANTAGFNDRYAYEMEKAMKEFKQDQEFALMRGTLVCGSGSAARSLKGIKAWLGDGNVTAQSGVSLSETMLNDYLQAVWDDGTEVNAIYAPMRLKRRISEFSASNKLTVNTEAADRQVVNAVDVYQADAASNVKLYAHRYVTVTGDNNYDLVGINEDFFKIAYLRNPKNVPLAKTGDAENAQIIGEMTLECKHEDGGFVTTALL